MRSPTAESLSPAPAVGSGASSRCGSARPGARSAWSAAAPTRLKRPSERPWSEVASLRMLRLDADVAQTLSCSRFLLAMAEVYMIDGAARRDAGSR